MRLREILLGGLAGAAIGAGADRIYSKSDETLALYELCATDVKDCHDLRKLVHEKASGSLCLDIVLQAESEIEDRRYNAE